MLIEPGSPVLDEGDDDDDVTLTLRLRELLDPPMTDWPGQAHVEAARQLRGLIAALASVADVLEAAGEAMEMFPVDYDGDDPESWAHDVGAFERIRAESALRLRAVLSTFDLAMEDGLQP